MRLRSNSYHMLICSLPQLPARFDADRLPITPERLQHRLRLLEPEDALKMSRMIDVLRWGEQFDESSDAAVLRRYGELMRGITNPLVREVLTGAMDVRMITTALRRRRRGMGPPPAGIGQWFEQIRRHFDRPDLGLGAVSPGLVRLEPLFEAGDVLNLYRELVGAVWAYLWRRADDYYFSFEAVVLYVARWNVIHQWQNVRADRGRPIFEALVEEALGEYANVYP